MRREEMKMNGRGSRIVVGVVGMTGRGLGLLIVLATIMMAPVSDTLAQAGGTAAVQNMVPGGRPPDAIDRATGLAEQPFRTLPMPAQPASPYIPDRRVYSPEVGREVEVPGHFAQRTPDGRVVEPPMTIPNPNGGPPVFLPGGVQPDSGVLPSP
jgi:hypothetical protein